MKLTFSSLQWMIFILAGSLVAPIAIGNAFGFSQSEIAQLLQRSFFIIGLSGILQAVFGHRLPITEGPAGLWWGVFTVYAGITASGAVSVSDSLHQLVMGMMIAGGMFIVLGLFKWITPIRTLFTPLVTGTYLLLLVSELSGSFMKGMFGIGYLSKGVNGKVALAAISVLVLSLLLGKSKAAWLKSYSILISLLAGWGIFYWLGIVKKAVHTHASFELPHPLAWGEPRFSGGISLTAVFIGLLLLTNMVASVNVAESAFESQKQPYQRVNYNHTSVVMGFNTWLAGLFSAVACVPISGTAGFILTTRMFDRIPFIIGNACIIMISFFPKLTYFFADIPAPVGYATIFLPFSSMAGLALKEYKTQITSENKLFIIGTSLMIGIGSFFIPSEALKGLPNILVTVLNNGLILGMLVCIILEQVTKRKDVLRKERL